MSMADRDGVIWYDGKLVPWRDATTHVLTHTLHYGMGVFEGVRAYETPRGTAVFRLKEQGIADLQGYGRGDELVRVHIEVPKKLTARQRELLEEYARNGGEEVSPLGKGFLDRVREMFG